MSERDYDYGVCGVFCEMCPTGTGKIANLAKELLRMIEGSYSWAKDSVDFSFDDLYKGLRWLSKDSCPTCQKIKDPWCEVLKCERAKELKSCLLCDVFLSCPKTSYHRDRYPFVIDHYHRVKEVGLEKHLEEERERTRKGITLIDIRKW
ncbi:MAG: DUF3795 domain-containing protein [Candidatus Thorarchaeota archaeon]